eukprot:TRINITY_DN3262_c0_g1_i29.p1 TRINITY_DN3262_c0_g1~~TRINITY_DN3262_c0_g1_i29.p1  ORF type:complete len:256 (+),score=-10.22 TRINITY_DN3262_c0_g1_i29:211-978(+)
MVFVKGSGKTYKRYAEILSISLENIKRYFDEKYDKGNFLKNVILDNILPGDIYIKARELQFGDEINRVCLLIRKTNNSDIMIQDVLRSIFPNKEKDFVINIDEREIVLIKEINENTNPKDLENLSNSILDTLYNEFYTECIIGIGSNSKNVKDLASSYKEAQIALEVSKVFDQEKNIVFYNHLGIARLIYQLPTTLCRMFLEEVLPRGSLDSLDNETLFTIKKFFENDLNVSETSRKLFIPVSYTHLTLPTKRIV